MSGSSELAAAIARQPSSLDPEALVVAMTLAPGVYARNRMFQFFKDPVVKRARDRAAVLRGVARQLASGASEVRFERRGGGCELDYRLERVNAKRCLTLTPVEAACVARLTRLEVLPFAVDPGDEEALVRVLARLAPDFAG